MPFQDSQSDIPIKKRLVKLLKENVNKNSQTIKVQGITENNAKNFDILEKELNNYKVLLDEFFAYQDSEDVAFSIFGRKEDRMFPISIFRNLISKLNRFGFDLIKTIKSIKTKDLTAGELEEIGYYMNDIDKYNQLASDYYSAFEGSVSAKELTNIFSRILNMNNKIITQFNILRTKGDIVSGTIYEPQTIQNEPEKNQMTGSGFFPKRYN